MAWTYDPKSRTYRDSRTGRTIRPAQLTRIRNLLADFTAESARLLAGRYATGALTLDEWALQFRTLLSDSTSAGYLLGRGGVNAIDLRDLARMDQIIRSQTSFAAQFARDLGSGEFTAEQIMQRASVYAGSAVHAYEQARAAGAGITLPTYPGDGSQVCLGNCRCEWVIEETENGYEATWSLDPAAQHCETCLENADKYAPFIQEVAAV